MLKYISMPNASMNKWTSETSLHHIQGTITEDLAKTMAMTSVMVPWIWRIARKLKWVDQQTSVTWCLKARLLSKITPTVTVLSETGTEIPAMATIDTSQQPATRSLLLNIPDRWCLYVFSHAPRPACYSFDSDIFWTMLCHGLWVDFDIVYTIFQHWLPFQMH